MGDLKFEVVKKLAETSFKVKNFGSISKLDSNSPPSIFIGSKLQYPLVNVGILSPVERDENSWIYDDAKYWAKNNFGINNVLRLRGGLVNSRFQSQVYDSRVSGKKFVEIAKEIAVASKPVDVEIQLKHKLRLNSNLDRVLTPNGMKGQLENAKITSNVSVDRQVDRVINDEIKSGEAIKLLYKKDFSEYTLSKILSVGVLGLKKNKRLVPTRWSITATDDTIGKQLLNNVRDYPILNDYEIFLGEFLGNQYLIMLFPDVWSYELFELYYPGSSWNPGTEMKASTDNEWFEGRTSYVEQTAGGYYASRLPIIEYLNGIKRQASVLVVRLETPSYWAALGVWVVRESVRKALERGVMTFNSREELIDSAKQIAKIKYDFDLNLILGKSKLLNQIKSQRKLGDFFT